jgi:hypothetical protein
VRIDCIHQPVILLGMHRSGTTMLAGLLAELGLFLGARLQDDHEAVYFLEANDRLLRNVNASWDNPSPFLHFLASPQAVQLSVRCLRGDVLSGPVRRFLGLRRYVKYRNVASIDGPWGWKDPRNVFTLPLWLQLFPEARIVNIVRNGIDVAASLRAREQRMLEWRTAQFERRLGRRPAARSRLQRAAYRGSARCLTLPGGFALWEEYVARAEQVLAQIPNERMTLVYERFLAEPLPLLQSLASFCRLGDATPQRLSAAASTVNVTRSSAFLRDSELAAFYQQVRTTPWMERYGYDRMT